MNKVEHLILIIFKLLHLLLINVLLDDVRLLHLLDCRLDLEAVVRLLARLLVDQRKHLFLELRVD